MHFNYFIGVLWWFTILSFSKQQELCGPLNGRTIYLQLGEHGKIQHLNQTYLEYHASHCGVELITCPSCSIEISINHLEVPQICPEAKFGNESSDNNCHCGSLAIWEPSGHAGNHLCKQPTENVFTSSTRSVAISFDSFGRNWTGSFSLSFIAQRNQIIINGMIGQNGHISSPNFPSLYPRDFGIEHVLSCMSENCTIELLFTDFLISSSSIMEFYDWDGRPLQLVSGIIARPPPIYSTGPSLTIRFFGNGGTSLGYKANYKFKINSTKLQYRPHTECGGEVDNLGGTIFMTGLSGNYDCIWTVQPAQSISHFKTHIYLKVLEYVDEGEFSIHLGQTSEDRLIETFTSDHKIPLEHVAPISKGFYISFKGTLIPKSKLVIAYSAFAYMDCLSGIDLLCGNKRCISIQLMCDSVDNCGDNSDEIGECDTESGPAEVSGQYWWPVKGGTTGNGSVLGGALLAAGAALVGVALLLAATLCRLALRNRPPAPALTPHHTDHARTIAHLLSIADLDDPDRPPIYEPPPEYSQVVKPIRPRRKQSAQRLIERDSPSQLRCDDDSILPTSSMCTEMKKDTALNQDLLSSAGLRRVSDNSPPMSLETSGYNDQDLGLSLTLSTSSPKGVSKFQDLQWLSTTPNRLESTPSTLSAVSFDTLHSSQERMVNLVPRLTKSHSQDNILRFRNGVPNTIQDSFCFNFHVQLPKENENLRESESNEDNCFSFSQPVLTHLRNISDGANENLVVDPQIPSTSAMDDTSVFTPSLNELSS